MPNQFQINAVAVLPFGSQTAAYEQKKKERCELPACCGRRQKQYNTMKNIIKAHLKPLAACLVFVFVAGLAGTYEYHNNVMQVQAAEQKDKDTQEFKETRKNAWMI